MLDSEKLTREEILTEYRDDVNKLLKYLPWLEQHQSGISASIYGDEGIAEHSMAFPVYDSTLLNFIKEVKRSKFLNKNYVYTYSKYRIKTVEDEKAFIKGCTLREAKMLGDILSKYAIKGSTKAAVWNEGANTGVYLCVLLKLKDIFS